MIGTKQEEITRLNQKLANVKAQPSKYDLPKQQEQPKPGKNFALGSKDQQVTVEVQKNEKAKKAGNFRVSNRQSAKSKMFTATININNEAVRESQTNPIEQITGQNPFVKKNSRNSNVMAHSSMNNVVVANAESTPKS